MASVCGIDDCGVDVHVGDHHRWHGACPASRDRRSSGSRSSHSSSSHADAPCRSASAAGIVRQFYTQLWRTKPFAVASISLHLDLNGEIGSSTKNYGRTPPRSTPLLRSRARIRSTATKPRRPDPSALVARTKFKFPTVTALIVLFVLSISFFLKEAAADPCSDLDRFVYWINEMKTACSTETRSYKQMDWFASCDWVTCECLYQALKVPVPVGEVTDCYQEGMKVVGGNERSM